VFQHERVVCLDVATRGVFEGAVVEDVAVLIDLDERYADVLGSPLERGGQVLDIHVDRTGNERGFAADGHGDWVQRIVDRIETEGYQVALVLAALTRLVARDEHPDEEPSGSPAAREEQPSEETAAPAIDPALFDRDFLRRAGIKGDLPA